MTPAVADLAAAADMPAENGRPPLLLLLVLSGLMSFGSLSTDMYLPAMPMLGLVFHVDVAYVQLTLTTFLLGFCSGQLVWGPMSDRYGRRIPAAAGIAIFVIGSAGCALAGSAGQMMAWRTVQALGASAGPVLARAMVRDLYTKNQAARMLSLLLLVMGVAPLLGPILGGQVLIYWNWQGIFWVQAALGMGGLVGVAAIRETLRRESRTRLSVTEMVVSYGQLARQRRLLGYALSSGFYYGAIYAYLAGTPFAYIDFYHVPAQQYGWLFGINILGMMALNVVNSRLVMRIGSDHMLRWGIWVTAGSGVALTLAAWTGVGGLAGLIVPSFVLIAINGAVAANAVAGALSAYSRKAGAASALLGGIQFAVGVFSTALTGWFANGTVVPYAAVIGAMGVCALASNLLLLRRPGVTA